MRSKISRWISPPRKGMSRGVWRRSRRRQQASRNSGVAWRSPCPGCREGLGGLEIFEGEKLADDGHLEFQRQGEAGNRFIRLDDAADDRQVKRGEEELGGT
jgi:hypothetical protein